MSARTRWAPGPAAGFRPAYLRLGPSELEERARVASRHLERCDLCARYCRVNRKESVRGAVCRTGERAWVDGVFSHFGEEACLTGWAGSGTRALFRVWRYVVGRPPAA